MENSKWIRLTDKQKHASERIVEHISFSRDVWIRFKSNKLSITGMVLIIFLVLFAFVGPLLTPHEYDFQEREFSRLPPLIKGYVIGEDLYYASQKLTVIEFDKSGFVRESHKKTSEDSSNKKMLFQLEGGKYLLDYSKIPLTLSDLSGKPLEDTRYFINRKYLFGTDDLGRDLLVRIMLGTRISLAVAFIAALVNFLIGVTYGGISGYAGGLADLVMMRVVDIINTIPLILYMILIMLIFEEGFGSIVIALGTVYWVNMARIVRAQVLSLKNEEYVIAAKTIGTRPLMIIRKHLIPNAIGPIIVTLTILIPSAIFVESFLSFIGLGISAPQASLGSLCSDAIGNLRSTPYQLLYPTATICIAMFAFNFVGDGLRTALDPKMRK